MDTGITGTTRTFFGRSYQVYLTEPIHTKNFHNIQQHQTYCELFHQTFHKHCQKHTTQDKQIH